jgi:hypothetical protein
MRGSQRRCGADRFSFCLRASTPQWLKSPCFSSYRRLQPLCRWRGGRFRAATARELCSTLDSMATPCSMKA